MKIFLVQKGVPSITSIGVVNEPGATVEYLRQYWHKDAGSNRRYFLHRTDAWMWLMDAQRRAIKSSEKALVKLQQNYDKIRALKDAEAVDAG